MTEPCKVLLVDDDRGVHSAVRHIVERAGYRFVGAFDGDEGVEAVLREKPDIMLLDVMLPGRNGFDVCREIRSRGRRIPIVFLSAKGDIVDKSIGFNAGGDDYVVKPFDTDELLLRIEAHLRRHKRDLSYAKAIERSDTQVVGDLVIDNVKYKCTRQGQSVPLTSKEFEILSLLAANPGQVFTRGQIYEHIWGKDSGVEESSITVFVRKIREKIEDNPSRPKYILTVRRLGYKLSDEL